jgi:pimeloyl-ACP methyl ester carboxylesterase
MDLKTGYVTSADGSRIGFYQFGNGPGLIILHGAMQHGLSHADLAKELAKDFTCYLPDRRGRGLSGNASCNYCIDREVEDVRAICRATRPSFVFGVSSGALIALKAAAIVLPQVERVAVFEPPWYSGSEMQRVYQWAEKLDAAFYHGNPAEAAVAGMLGAEMGPPLFRSRYFPRMVLTALTRLMLRSDKPFGVTEDLSTALEPCSKTLTFHKLVPTLCNDFNIVLGMLGEEQLQRLSTIQLLVLILGGDQSPRYLQSSVRELEKVLPNATRVELQGIGHGGTANKAFRGKPEIFAVELKRFFLEKKV